MDVYPLSSQDDHPHRFQAYWFKVFHWLVYSPDEDAAYCFPCYLFSKRSGSVTLK